MDFSQIKRNSGLDNLQKKVEKLSKGYNRDDDRFWTLTPDKAGNAMAVIRFLPLSPEDAADTDALEWVTVFRHSFQGPGGWLIEECPTTIDEPCPVCEANKKLWATETEENKKIASNRKRQLKYVSNVYIVSDPGNPDNNGKVKLFKYGAKIFKKIQSAMTPDFEGETAIDPFDLWTGANFKVKKTGKGRDSSYDESAFQPAGPLFKDDAKLEEVWKAEYSLKTFYDPKNFTDYDAIKARLVKVTGGEATSDPEPKVPSGLNEFSGYEEESSSEPTQSDMDWFKNMGKDEETGDDVPF